MKALTVWQPHATLIAAGVKRIETRGWETSYREDLLIHAAKKWDKEIEAILERPTMKPLLKLPGVEHTDTLPRGAVVAVARLMDCIQMTPDYIAAQTQQERNAGVWSVGRFGWVLEDVRPLAVPFATLGAQGLWECSDADLLKQINALERAG